MNTQKVTTLTDMNQSKESTGIIALNWAKWFETCKRYGSRFHLDFCVVNIRNFVKSLLKNSQTNLSQGKLSSLPQKVLYIIKFFLFTRFSKSDSLLPELLRIQIEFLINYPSFKRFEFFVH